jgi:orotidine-5'-phosphate decarboxylase
MNAIKKLRQMQEKNHSLICLGLDVDPKKMPSEYGKSIKGIFDFTQRIVEASQDVVCAYKPNLAFYENLGPEGLSLLALVIKRIPEDMPIILDAKRGDIGSTAAHYAQALFERYSADWVTVNPYMGYDSIRPFIEFEDKGVFVLCLTSNPGHKDFQMLKIEGRPLYELVAEKVAYWNKDQNFGLVVGATAPEQLKLIRNLAGEMPLLIPGVGAQGGSLEKAATLGTANFTKLALINVSRSVLYASREEDFAQRARQELTKLNDTIKTLRNSGQALGKEAEPKPDTVNEPSVEQTPPEPPQPPESRPSDVGPTPGIPS